MDPLTWKDPHAHTFPNSCLELWDHRNLFMEYSEESLGFDRTWANTAEKAMAPHSSTLAWKIPWTGEPGRLQSMGVTKSRTRLNDFTFTFHFHALEKEMATHSSVFAWRIPGTGEPGGLPSMGSHRVGHNWSDLEAAAAAARFLSVVSLLTHSPQKPKLNSSYSAIFPFQPLPRMYSDSFLILLGLKSTHYSYVQIGSILPHCMDSKSHIFSPHPWNWNES